MSKVFLIVQAALIWKSEDGIVFEHLSFMEVNGEKRTKTVLTPAVLGEVPGENPIIQAI